MRVWLVVTIGVISLLVVGTATAAPVINLPRTGQTTCYDANGNKLASCTATGQDGATLIWQFYDTRKILIRGNRYFSFPGSDLGTPGPL